MKISILNNNGISIGLPSTNLPKEFSKRLSFVIESFTPTFFLASSCSVYDLSIASNFKMLIDAIIEER